MATEAGMQLRAAAAVILILGSASLAAAASSPAPADVVEGPYIVVDVDSGRVIEEFDALRPWYPASTTKLMTIYVTFEAIRAGEISLDTEITYSANAASQPPSKMGFRPGTMLTLDNALKMMMVKSANDIAVAVAEAVGGSIDGFANRMNAAALRLGMTRSHFTNPNGLPDENNYSSARDMALVARALLTEFHDYADYYKLHAIQIGGKVLKNYNTLLARYPGATGMKTGFICASGYNLVASAKRGEREVIAVIFGQYGGKIRAERAAKLLNDGFASSPPADGTSVRLADAASGASYDEPFDMHAYVCGPKRVRIASEEGDDEDGPRLTEHPIDLGPPVRVSAYVPAVYGEPGYVARLPRARPGPGSEADPAVLNAYAPGAGTAESAPADAIGVAAGKPRPLDNVAAPPQ
jgi:D-alanyl-D-alanine carboxypeptidase